MSGRWQVAALTSAVMLGQAASPVDATAPPASVAVQAPAPRPSAGCAPGLPAAPVEAAISHQDAKGFYVLSVPPTTGPAAPMPVVVDLHGYSAPTKIQVAFSGLAAYGVEHGFITVNPQVERPVPRWITDPRSADLGFLEAVLDAVEAVACVDTSRVYVAGMSNGAMMASRVACELSDRITAVALVAGAADPPECDPGRAMPVVAFHGTSDQYLAYTGGLGPAVATLPNPDGAGTFGTLASGTLPGVDMRPVPEIVGAWAGRSGCQLAPTERQFADLVTEFDYSCPVDTDTQLYRIEGGGHTWPGSAFAAALGADSAIGMTTMAIDANQVMWQFFQRFALPAA